MKNYVNFWHIFSFSIRCIGTLFCPVLDCKLLEIMMYTFWYVLIPSRAVYAQKIITKDLFYLCVIFFHFLMYSFS